MSFVDKANPENIIDAATRRQKDRASGQTSFFDMFGDIEGSGFEVSVPEPDGQEWDRHTKLSAEQEKLLREFEKLSEEQGKSGIFDKVKKAMGME